MRRSIPFLWALVIILLVLNLALLYGLNRARLTVIETLDKVESTLDGLQHEVVAYDIEVNQAMPIIAEVPLNQTLEIPINTVIPIDQVLTLPFQTGNGEVEIDMPVKTDFPINMMVPVDFNETINVDTVVELNTTVPIEVDIAKTPLADYLAQAKQDVNQLRRRLALQREATVMTVAATPSNSEAVAVSVFASENTSSQVIPTEREATIESSITRVQELDAPESPSVSIDDSASRPNNADPLEADLGSCAHIYWPLRVGTMWTYASSDTSYTQRVEGILNNQVYMNTRREGQDIQFDLVCYQEGLGGSYLGDARIITKFGNLEFSNPRGMFLPRPDILENVGTSWTQEYDVAGTIEALQGNKPIVGRIVQGQAVTNYTPTGFETLKTPLGPREALRIEQNLNLELNVDFDLNNQTIPVIEMLNLTIVYWFVEGIGPVKIHWQGGTIQYDSAVEEAAINQQISIPALPEENIISVCVLLQEDSAECMQVDGVSSSDLAVKPVAQLNIQSLVFPDNISGEENKDDIKIVGLDESLDTSVETEKIIKESPDINSDDIDQNSRQSALLAYAETAANLGEKINEAADEFGKSAVAYRDGEITIDEFRSKFDSFAPKVKGYIQQVDALSPPPEAEAIHQKLTGGLSQCDKAIDLMDGWFDTHDTGTKEATMLLVASCIDQVTSARDELQDLITEN